jgi:carboxymethylenebutenolidase
MKASLVCLPCIAAAVGFGLAATRPAAVVNEHAHHGEAVAAAGVAVQQAPGIPPGEAGAMARLAASPRTGQWATIKVGDKDSVVAWVVRPPGSARAPVVIVIHDNRGMSSWARSVADQLAADGFIGIVPELATMHRTADVKTDLAPNDYSTALSATSADEVQRELDAVAKYGMALPNASPKYGVVGFCWGGGHSFGHAVHAPGLGAAVVYYGSTPAGAGNGPIAVDQLAAIKAPVLGLYAGNDARISARVPATDSAMKKLAKTYDAHVFDGAGHGFLRGQEAQGGPNLEASKQAWPLTIAWFKKYLSS